MRTIRVATIFVGLMLSMVGALAQSLSISPPFLPSATVGVPYSRTLTASGGTPPYSWNVDGTLPPGLSLSPNGVLSGTPTQAGIFSFYVFVSDSSDISAVAVAAFAVQPYTLQVFDPPILISPPMLPNGLVGVSYSRSISASGGTGAFRYTVSSGTLPTGLTFDPISGTLSGVPTTAGTFSFSIIATDTAQNSAQRSYTVSIFNEVALSPATLPNGAVGSVYSQTFSASGGTGSFSFTVTGGALPTGLTLNSSTGVLSGTPATAGTFNFSVTATDSGQNSATLSYALTILNAISLTPASLMNGTIGANYSQAIAAAGGTGSFTFAVTGGSLPAGLSLDANSGVLSGTPTSAGASTFTVTATDTAQNSASRSYTVTVLSAVTLSPPVLPNGTVGAPYSQTFSASGGTGSFTFSISSGTLPPGLNLNAGTGVLSGTPSAIGTSTFTVTATDSTQNSASRSYSVSVFAAITLSPAALPNGTVGSAYSQTVSAAGGTGSFTFAVTVGALPAGLTLNTGSGLISGTPTTAGTSTFTITATDTAQVSASISYIVGIFDAPALSPATLPTGTVGAPYSQTFSGSGGTGAFTFTIASGTLPPGLTLNATTGILSGSPTAAGSSTFTVAATDAAQNSANRTYTMTVLSAVALTPATLPNGTVGMAYSQTLGATGGTGSFTFSVTAGALPAGLTLNAATGTLAGTPTTVATSNFTVAATDAAQNSATRAYTITIVNPTGTMQVVSGDKQVVPADTGAPVNLIARVIDGSGNPVPGAEVTWSVVQGAGALSNESRVSDTQGLVQAAYTTGPGAVDNLVRVTATGSGSSFTFTIRNQQKAVVEPAKQLVTPQALLAINTPIIQLNNIRQRLDQLRLQRNPAVTELLRVSVDGRPLPPMSAFALAKLDKNGKPQRGGGASADKSDPFDRWGGFVNGDINIGRQSAVDTQTGFRLRSRGITLGTDYRFSGNHVLGAAVGFMKADTTLDAGAGTQDADGYSVSLFGSLAPAESAYVDGILNVGRNNYDTERRSAGGSFGSSTSGNQWGLAVNAGYVLNRGALSLTPFARVEHVDAKVDGFTERGNREEALTVGEQRLKATTMAVGGQVSYAISTSWGVLLPNGRIEYLRIANSNTGDVTARIAADTVSLPARFRALGDDKNFGSFALGISGVFARGFSGFLSYERQFARDNLTDERYLLGIRAEF